MALTLRVDGRTGTPYLNGPILDLVAAPTDGTWVQFNSSAPMTVTVEATGTGTFTAQVCVSNQENPPYSTEHGAPLGANLTTSGTRLVDAGYRWVKVRILTVTGSLFIRADGFGIPGRN